MTAMLQDTSWGRTANNKRLSFHRTMTFSPLKRTAGLRHRNVFFGCVLTFSPEMCKFLIFPFPLHVYIIMMNFYAGFFRWGCIFIHTFSLPFPRIKIMWYLQPISGRKAGSPRWKRVNLIRYFRIYTFGGADKILDCQVPGKERREYVFTRRN